MKKQFYGIKYPFTIDGDENYFVDLNHLKKDKYKCNLMHLIFTPKGQKIRDPEFGTDLIRYIFEPSDDFSFEEIKMDVSDAIRRYIPNIKINDLEIMKSDEDYSSVYVKLDYTVSDGINLNNDKIIVRL